MTVLNHYEDKKKQNKTKRKEEGNLEPLPKISRALKFEQKHVSKRLVLLFFQFVTFCILTLAANISVDPNGALANYVLMNMCTENPKP